MIDTQAIRSKILDLAMRGRLTEQLPKDGTAEELYRQIQAERKRQESIGTIKTVELAPDVYETEMPFAIPSNWKWTSLGNVSYIVRGGSPRPIKQYITTSEDGINWIKIGDVEKGGKYICSTHEKIIPEGEAKSRRVYPGDFLLTNSMSFGRPYISKIEGCIHDGWLLIHNLTGFDQDYLFYLLSSSYLYGQFTAKASGSTVDNLNIDKVKAALIPLPPLAEQHRIVSRIDQAFATLDTIDALQAKYADNLAVLKSKLIDAAIRGKLTEQLPEDGTAEDLYRQIQAEKQALIKSGKIKKEKPLPPITADEIPLEIPSNWKWVRIGTILTLQSGKNIPASNIETASDEAHKIPCYGGNGQRGFVDCANVDGFHAIIGRQGALCGNINFAEGPFYATEHAVVVYGYAGTNMKWVGITLRYLNLNQYATSVAQPGLAVSKVEKVLIPLPPLAEQKRIVAKLEELLPLCERLK